jgi:adenosylcobinamide-phosphate synthase
MVHWLLVVGAFLAAWWGPHLALAAWSAAPPWLGFAWDLYWAMSLLCLRDLFDHGRAVLTALAAAEPLPAARAAVARLVGRDTAPMDRGAVVRATIESMGENLTDAVLTPLWGLCLAGLPGLIVVKACSTLDSMVGYKNDRYLRFGWAGARSDDALNWLPARLSPLVIALAACVLRVARTPMHPYAALRAAWRWHAVLPSPNSGWAEAAYAGALRARLLGPIFKGGTVVNDLWMGDTLWPHDLGEAHLRRALALTMVSGWIAVLVGVPLAMVCARWWPS